MEFARAPEPVLRNDGVQQLDFAESMLHFKSMFPTIDEELIVDVLRANNGALDTTVDQLLDLSSSDVTLSSDVTATSEELSVTDCSGDTSASFMTKEELAAYQYFAEDYESSASSEVDGEEQQAEEFYINVLPPSPAAKQPSPRQQRAALSDATEVKAREAQASSDQSDGQCFSAHSASYPISEQHTGHTHSRPGQSEASNHGHYRAVQSEASCHDYANVEVARMPGIPEEGGGVAGQPVNLMDASITDIANLTNNVTDQMSLLTVDQEESVFVTPTNQHLSPAVPDAPLARNPRDVTAARTKPANQPRARAMSVPVVSDEHWHLSPVSLYNKYRHVAMVGRLPEDFLRVRPADNTVRQGSGGESRQAGRQGSGGESRQAGRQGVDELDASSQQQGPAGNPHPRYHRRSASEQSHVMTRLHFPGSRVATSRTQAGAAQQSQLGVPRQPHQHKRSHSSREQKLRSPKKGEQAHSGDWVMQRLVENIERRVQLMAQHSAQSDDVERSCLHTQLQLLEDENLALLLQNDEFLRELKHDEDFMGTLRADRSLSQAGATEIAGVNPWYPDRETQIVANSGGIISQNEASGNVPAVETATVTSADHVTAPRDPDSAPRDPVVTDLRHDLKNMTSASKKKFLAAAKRFFSRKKKAPGKPLYSQGVTPSTLNLLEDEDGAEFDSHFMQGSGQAPSHSALHYG